MSANVHMDEKTPHMHLVFIPVVHTTDKKGIAEIIIAKQRNGPIGTVRLAWLSNLTKFANIEYRNSNY